jgi:predicted RNA binding protein YcfA (HicA-like mRNA interferase family)
MPKLPTISGDDCIKALQRLGYRVDRIRGSHVWMTCYGKQPIPVPRHDELGKGLLRKIIKTVDISVDEFISLLK